MFSRLFSTTHVKINWREMWNRYEMPQRRQTEAYTASTYRSQGWEPNHNIAKTRRQKQNVYPRYDLLRSCRSLRGHYFEHFRLSSWDNASQDCWVLFKFGVHGVVHNLLAKLNVQMDKTYHHFTWRPIYVYTRECVYIYIGRVCVCVCVRTCIYTASFF